MRILSLAKKEIILKAPYLGIFDLKDLIKERAQQVFASVAAEVIPDTLMITNEKLETPPEKITNVLTRLTKVPHPHKKHQIYEIFIGELFVNDHIQPYRIRLTVDPLTFKHPSQDVWLKWISELSIHKEALNKPIIPPGVSLNKLANHPNAPYIYNHLFEAVSAYRDILLDILSRDMEDSNHPRIDCSDA